MKRKILAWIAAIAIVAAVSAAFLRPVRLVFGEPRDVYTFADEQATPIRLIGRDAALFSAELTGVTLAKRFYAELEMHGVSPDRYYTVGLAEWDTTHRSYSEYRLGYVERLGEDGWKHCCDVEYLYSTSGLASNAAENVVVPPGEHCYPITAELPIWTPGRYRVMLTVRDFHPTGYGMKGYGHDLDYVGKSGEEVYEVGFEYTVPKTGSEPMDVLLVDLTQNPEPKYSDLAYLDIALRANGNIRYLVPESVRFEQLDESGEYVAADGGEYPAVTSVIDTTGDLTWVRDSYVEWLGAWLDRNAHKYADEFTLVPVEGLVLRGWNPTDPHRLTLEFSENPDGSGERYTVTIDLNFSKEASQ